MVGAILAILERVWKVASGESPLPSPEWADESYVKDCGELSDEEKRDKSDQIRTEFFGSDSCDQR